jgi:hypothetical protein
MRSGEPLACNSRDIAAGIQYCRINPPIGVPGPTRVKISLSFTDVIAHLFDREDV